MAKRNSKFLLKRSNTSGKVPLPGDLLLGELALNTADVILYTSGTTANQILPIGWDRLSITGGTVTGNVTVTGNITSSGLTLTNITNATGDFITIDGSNIIRRRTSSQVLTDIGAQPLLTNPITGTGTSGQISFFNGTTTQTGDNGLFWDNTNKRLGIGTSTPSVQLELTSPSSSALLDPVFRFYGHNSLLRTVLENNGTQRWFLADGTGVERGSIQYSVPGGNVGILFTDTDGNSRSDFHHIRNEGGFVFGAGTGSGRPPERVRITNIGRVGIGTSSPSELLHVEGRARITTIDNGTGDFVTISGTGVLTRRTSSQVLSDISAVPTSRTLTAGNGLTGGGNLTANRTFTLGTPSSITLSSANSVTADSHTHEFAPGGTTAQYIRGDGSLETFPTIGDGTLTLTTSGIATGSQTFTANQISGSTFTVNVPGTNISQGTRTSTTVPITSSTGTDATLNVATTTLAGVMSAADKTKLDGVETGAQVNTVTSVANKTGAVTLNNSDVGLGNVTNHAQVRKISSSTNGNVPIWDGTAGNLLANGYGVETTLTGGSNNLVRADAIKSYVDNILASNDAMIFKGTLGTGGTVTALPTTHNIGWTFKVITAGTYAGQVAEIGDMYISLVNRTGTGNQNSDWAVIQTNIDGAVTGPSSSVNNHVALFDGTSGKIIKSSGVVLGSGTLTLSTSGIATGSQTFGANQNSNATFTVNVPGTDLAMGGSGNSRTITSSTGNNVSIPVVTTSNAGFMSTGDKTKLDGISANANNYVHPTGFSNQPTNALTGASVISRVLVNNEGHVTGVDIRSLTPINIGAEPAITSGTTSQYFRGDKTFQTLNTSVVPESGNLYYTDTRSRAALSFVAGSGSYNSTTGVITIPTNTNQLTNGAGFTTNTGTVTSIIAGDGLSGGTITTSGTISVDTTVVRTSGNQTIDGVKTFSNNVTINNTLGLRASSTTSSATQIPVFTANPASTTRTLVTRTPAQLRSDIGAEPSFTKNTAFNKNFGTTAGTVAEGNDSRILNGQTAFGWGNHATQGYLTSNQTITLSGDVTGSGTTAITTTIANNAITTAKIGNSQVTLAKIANIGANTILGNNTGSPTSPIALTATQIRTLLNVADGATANTGTVTNVSALTIGTTGTDVNSSVVNSTTTPVITLNIPTASSTNRGVLSSTDWTTFNNKQNALTNPVTGTGVNGRVAFWDGVGSISSDAGFLFNTTTKVFDLNGISSYPSILLRASVLTGSVVDITRESAKLVIRNSGAFDTEFWTNNLLRWSILSNGILQSNGAQTIRTSTGNLTLATAAGNGNIILSPHGTGNVGIGTSSPEALLHVVGNARLSQPAGSDVTLALGADNNTNSSQDCRIIFSANNAGGFSVASSEILATSTGNGQGVLAFLTRPGSGSRVEHMRITSAGNVGIGTTSPSRKLSIEGTAYLRNSIQILATDPVNGSSQDTEILIQSKGQNSSVIRSSQWRFETISDSSFGNSGFRIRKNFDGGSTIEYIRINSSGNVGINTTSPSERLHVAGRVRIETIDNGTGDFATISGTGVITRRTAAQVKNDIGVTDYDWILKDDPSDTGVSVVSGDGVVFRGINGITTTRGTGAGGKEIVIDGSSLPSGSVTSVAAGNGMTFSTITNSGSVTLGTPSNITLSSTNSVTTDSHTHAFTPGGTTAQYIRGNGTLATFPTIPTVNNPTITLSAGTVLSGGGSFTLNQVGGQTITFNHETVDRTDTTSSASPNFGGSVNVIGGVITTAEGHITEVDTLTLNIPSLPASATRGEISLTNITNASSSTLGFISGRRFVAGWNDLHPNGGDSRTMSGATVLSEIIVDSNGHVTSTDVRNLTSGDIGAEPSFTKNTAFNKNFGTTAGTVAEGNDSRILNGQTAFGWGNHATVGYAISGTGGSQVRTNTQLDARYLQSVNLGYTAAATNGVVTNTAGNNATIPAATTSLAGLMTNTDKTKLDGIEAGAQVNVATNLGITAGTTAGPIVTSSTGTNATLPTATASASGVVTTGNQTWAGVKTFNSTIVGSINGNAGTATTLQTARTINGTSFNGSANITTANWGTARNITIGSTTKSVNGSGNVSWTLAEIGAAATSHTHTASQISNSTTVGQNLITLTNPGAITFLRVNADNTVDALNAANFRTAIGAGTGTLSSVNLGYTAAATNGVVTNTAGNNATIPAATTSLAGLMTNTDKSKLDGIEAGAQVNVATNLGITAGTTAGPIVTSSTGTNATLPTASASASGVVTTGNQTWAGVKTFNSTIVGSINGNAGTATTLQTARQINGTNFNGSANITTANWGTARNITIGSTTKSVNGSGNVSWTLAEIGAQAAGNFVTIDTTQTITGAKTFDGSVNIIGGTNAPLMTLTQTGSGRPLLYTFGGNYGGPIIRNTDTGGRSYQIATTRNSSSIGGGKFIISDVTDIDRPGSDTSSSGDVRIGIDNVGNVGIGTTSPSERLHVAGRARITTIDNGTGDFATISGTGVITRRTAAQVRTDIGAGTLSSVNLGYTAAATNGVVTNTAGNNATIPAATTSLAGLMTNTDKTKLDGIEAGAQVNVATNLGSSGTGGTRTITSSTGTNTSITFTAADLGAVPTSRTLTGGDGIQTVGDLSANRTIAVDNTVVRTSGNQTLAGVKTFTNNVIINNTLDLRASASTSVATQIPVFIADPSSTTRTLVTRTPAQLRSDIGAGTLSSVNLGYTAAATNGVVTNTAGNNATIPAATTSLAGLMTNTDKTKLDGIEAGAQVNVATNLGITAGTTAGPIVTSSTGTNATLPTATASASGVVTTGNQTWAGVKTFNSTISGSINGNAGTATTLQTARTINGTSFNGSANITTANWGTARTITIGSTGKSVNGSGNVSWTLAEIGAQASLTNPITGTGTRTTNFVPKFGSNTNQIQNSQIFDNGTNIGIGTTTPSSKLEVDGNVSIGYTNAAPTNGMIISGDVGIGTTSPTAKLEISQSGGTALNIEGSSGQLFSVIDTLTGVLMSVNDISGLPILEVLDNDRVVMGSFGAKGLIVDGSDVILPNTSNTTGDILTIDSNNIVGKRTVGEILGDINAVPTSRTITINSGDGLSGGASQNLGDNRTWNLSVDSTVIRTTGNQTIGGVKTFSSTIVGSINGNAGTATTLQTARTINGTSFNGSANITTANWGTARTITIGSTGKSVNGSGNVSWTLAEIGAQAALTNPVTGTGTSGQVSFFNGTTTQTGDNGLFWDNTNKRLGIGTNSPTQRLDVDGNILIRVGNTINFRDTNTRIWEGSGLNIDSGDSRVMNLISGGSTRVRVQTNGNVGIGTTVPNTALYIARGAVSTVPALGEPSSHFAVGNPTNYGTMIGTLGSGVGYIQQQRFDNTATFYNLLIQPNGGNVGIGTTSPSESLHVAGRVRITTIDNGTGDFATISGTGVITRRTATQVRTDIGAGTLSSVNLGYTTAATNGTITNTAGNNATIPAATTSLAGLMTNTDKTKLDGIEVGAQVNVATNLGITAGTTAGPIVTSSTGTNATLPTASASASGVVTTGNQTWAGVKTFNSTISGSINGNAGTATTLQTARQINGTNFNGSANITTANWGTSRTITIGGTGKSVNGSGNVSWTLAEIGAAAVSHTHTASQISNSTTVGQNLITLTNPGAITFLRVNADNTVDTLNAANFRTAIGAGTGTLSSVNLGYTAAATNGVVTNTAGNNATIPAATTSLAGLMTNTDKTKLDGIEAGAQVNVATNLGITAGTTAGPIVTSSTGTNATLPTATASASGVVTTGNQTWAGVKTFTSDTVVEGLTIENMGSVASRVGLVLKRNTAEFRMHMSNSRLFIEQSNVAQGSAIVIGTNNNVGIGLDGDPSTKLQVEGTLSLQASATSSVATQIPVFTANPNGTTRTLVTRTPAQLRSDIGAGTLSSVNLGYTAAATNGVVTNTAGNNATIPAATTSLAGLMTNTDKTKLDGIEVGAQVNVATNLGITAGTTAGPIVTSSTGTNATLPTASASASGVVTTGNQTWAGVKTFNSTISGSINGNAGTATTLQTARTINGTSFNGSANITTANWGTARTITIGSTGKSVNGSGNVSWSLAEIGAAATSHTHTAAQISNSTTVGQNLITLTNPGAITFLRVNADNTVDTLNAANFRTAIGAGTGTLSSVNLGYTTAATNGTITNTAGNNATIPAATTSLAGLMTNTDKSKLDGIEAGAQVNVATNLGITAGTTAGPIVTSSTGTNATLPTATASASGVVTTGNQTWAGIKTFSSAIVANGGITRASTLDLSATGNNIVRINTNGGERLRVAGNGDVLMGTTSALTGGGRLQVNGNINTNKRILSGQENLTVDTGALRVIAQISSSNHDAVFFDYVIKKGNDLRAGTVYAVHNGTDVEFTETSTNDIGNTNEVELSVDISGGNVRLLGKTDTNGWQIKTLVRGI